MVYDFYLHDVSFSFGFWYVWKAHHDTACAESHVNHSFYTHGLERFNYRYKSYHMICICNSIAVHVFTSFRAFLRPNVLGPRCAPTVLLGFTRWKTSLSCLGFGTRPIDMIRNLRSEPEELPPAGSLRSHTVAGTRKILIR